MIDATSVPMSYSPMRISESEAGQAWLGQFRPDDVPHATKLLENLTFVSTSTFRQWLAEEIIRQAKHGRLALYGEREFPPNSRFFNILAPGRVKRAIGAVGPQLVKPSRGSSYVGSEGIVGQLLSELARRRDVNVLLTPGPDRLRPMKSRGATRRLAIVTDIVGSGNRIYRMLDAMWRTESIRSWHSHSKVNLEILVVAYATSPMGQTRIESHRLKPRLIPRLVVPTIWDIEDSSRPFDALCARYEPQPTDENVGPFGYEDAGTLIAFGHGCPNTAPPMFWRKGKCWHPLFPERSGVEFDLFGKPADVVEFGRRLLAVNRPSLADPQLIARFAMISREAMLLLATISHGLRDSVRLASRTGLDVPRIASLLEAFRSAGWVTASNFITAKGLEELKSIRRVVPRTPDIPIDGVCVYYPTSLRG